MRTLIHDSKDRRSHTGYIERETHHQLSFASILLLLWGLSSPLEGKKWLVCHYSVQEMVKRLLHFRRGHATLPVHILSRRAQDFAQRLAVSAERAAA
jgi:hypothetical protein